MIVMIMLTLMIMKVMAVNILLGVQEESEGGMTEIRFIPADKSRLDALFQV